jgi:hypothetical protein
VSLAQVRWARGGEAEVLAVSADSITLRSTVPWPPGARAEGALVGDGGAVLRVKVHACRREPDGAYALEGRPLDLAKELRAKLERTGSRKPESP